VEHPFGTIKRQWGFDYTLMTGTKKVDGEVGLIFIAYLFTKLMNILGVKGLMEAIASILLLYKWSKLVIKRRLIDFLGFLQYISDKNPFVRYFVISL
jgi:hypothetical protein